MDIELIADTLADDLSYQDGAARIVDLLLRLQQLPEFSTGWHLPEGGRLEDGEAAFIEAAQEAAGTESLEIAMHQLTAVTGLTDAQTGQWREHAVLSAQFGSTQIIPPHLRIGMIGEMADLTFLRRLTKVLLSWAPVQHVKIADPYYAMEDAPIDPRRRGIGWAGWVPFTLTRDQVPEAAVVEPLGKGTFLASGQTWDVSRFDTIANAQNLELRLNALGVLPTFEDLAKGDWGALPSDR